jgi:hypothetical protein
MTEKFNTSKIGIDINSNTFRNIIDPNDNNNIL